MLYEMEMERENVEKEMEENDDAAEEWKIK